MRSFLPKNGPILGGLARPFFKGLATFYRSWPDLGAGRGLSPRGIEVDLDQVQDLRIQGREEISRPWRPLRGAAWSDRLGIKKLLCGAIF